MVLQVGRVAQCQCSIVPLVGREERNGRVVQNMQQQTGACRTHSIIILKSTGPAPPQIIIIIIMVMHFTGTHDLTTPRLIPTPTGYERPAMCGPHITLTLTCRSAAAPACPLLRPLVRKPEGGAPTGPAPRACRTTGQGLTSVHFSAQLKRFLWDRGHIEGLVGGCLAGVWGF